MQNFTTIKSTFITSSIKAAIKKLASLLKTLQIYHYIQLKNIFSMFLVDLKLAEIKSTIFFVLTIRKKVKSDESYKSCSRYLIQCTNYQE